MRGAGSAQWNGHLPTDRVGTDRETKMSTQPEMRTTRQTIDQPLAYTEDEALEELKIALKKLAFYQELEIRRSKDRPSPLPSVVSGKPSYVTIAKVALVKVPKYDGSRQETAP